MNKRNLRLSRGGAVKASLLMSAASILAIGCGKGSGIEHEIGNTSSTSTCTLFFCGTTGTGGSAGATGNGGTGGHGGDATSVGGSGGGSSSSNVGGNGGSAGAVNTGGAGGFGGNTTSNTGGAGGTTTTITGTGGTTTSTSGNGGYGGATTTATDAGVGGAGGASTTATDAGAVCTVDQKGCDNVCVAKNDPAYGCSIFACSACPVLANATSACGANQDCVIASCAAGFGNCDNNAANGCESQFDSDPNNCGACGTVCVVNSLCQGGSCVQQPLNSFSCSGWTRDLAFDAFKIPDQNNKPADVETVGGIWGTSGDDFYISAATYGKGAVAHWYGGKWVLESLPGDPGKIYGIWGSGPDDVWLAAESVMQGSLYHRVGGAWLNVANMPYTISFVSVWGADSDHVYVTGQDAGFGKVWMKSGANWVDTKLPSPMQAGDIGFAVFNVWGFDSTHVFVTGKRLKGQNNNAGVFWTYDGSAWKIIQTPQETKGLVTVHGTSIQDFYVSGGTGAGAIIYHVTNKMATWTPFVNPNLTSAYVPLLSLKAGTFLTATSQSPPGGAGSHRITTGDQISPEKTVPVDNKAQDPISFWREPGTMKIHLVLRTSISYPAGHYVGNCL